MAMSKTPFSNKCSILGQLWQDYHNEKIWDENWIVFFQWADIALPMAYLEWQGLAVIASDNDGPTLIDNTWMVFCEALGIDPNAYYDFLDDCLDASPNPELEVFDNGQR